MTSLRHAKGCAADLYSLVRTVTKRLGRFDLSLLAADRAVRAAEAANDALRLGVARWNLAQVLLADGQLEGAEMVAMRAADALRPLMAQGEADAAAVYGAYRRASLGAVSNVWETRNRLLLEYLEKLADQLRSGKQIVPAQLEEQTVRLLAGAVMSLRQHEVKRGQCQVCGWSG